MTTKRVEVEQKSPEGLYLRGVTWWIRYRGPREDGSWGEIRESADTTDQKRAERLRAARVVAVTNHRSGIRRFEGPGQEKVTVGALLANLEKDYATRRIKSPRETANHMRPVKAFFQWDRATGLTTKRIHEYIEERREAELADKTIDNELTQLNRAYTLALESNPPLVAFAPRVPRLVAEGSNARQGFYSRAEFLARLKELPSQLLKDIAEWGYSTAMRLGSVLDIGWDGYDRETGTLRLHQRDSKTGEPVVVTLAAWPTLAEIIERRLQARIVGSPLIFHNGRGGRVGDFYTTWVRAGDRAKVPHRTYHDLRRTAARNLRSAGVPESVIMAIGGWKTANVFRRYAIIDETDVATALAKGAAYVEGLPKEMERASGGRAQSAHNRGRSARVS